MTGLLLNRYKVTATAGYSRDLNGGRAASVVRSGFSGVESVGQLPAGLRNAGEARVVAFDDSGTDKDLQL